jgi:prepilin-type N-terminal cleavage/methylation domain-containing protein
MRSLLWRWHLLRDSGERGVTLVEVIVAMMILGIVTTMVSQAVVTSARNQVRNDDENRGLQDAKRIMDRMGRDVRQARGVVCDGGLADPTDATSGDAACAAHLQLWIDYDSDYVQDSSEVVTWRLQTSADGEHYDVWRVQGEGAGATGAIQATSLIVRTLFTYDTADPADAQVVTLNMQYDAIVGAGVRLRDATFSARLRNKGTE